MYHYLEKLPAKWLSVSLAAIACTSVQATIINTGFHNGNFIDSNWTLASISDINNIPVNPNFPNAYVVNLGPTDFPFPTWIPNDSVSSWISYSNPLYSGGDNTSRTFSYAQTFQSLTETISFRWLSDNDSRVYIDNMLVGSRMGTGNYFFSWDTPVSYSLLAGTHTVRVEVDNFERSSGNPTGMRFETVVPETSTYVTGALVLIPVVGQLLRRRQVGSKQS
jgi:hypothetical protein